MCTAEVSLVNLLYFVLGKIYYWVVGFFVNLWVGLVFGVFGVCGFFGWLGFVVFVQGFFCLVVLWGQVEEYPPFLSFHPHFSTTVL